MELVWVGNQSLHPAQCPGEDDKSSSLEKSNFHLKKNLLVLVLLGFNNFEYVVGNVSSRILCCWANFINSHLPSSFNVIRTKMFAEPKFAFKFMYANGLSQPLNQNQKFRPRISLTTGKSGWGSKASSGFTFTVTGEKRARCDCHQSPERLLLVLFYGASFLQRDHSPRLITTLSCRPGFKLVNCPASPS